MSKTLRYYNISLFLSCFLIFGLVYLLSIHNHRIDATRSSFPTVTIVDKNNDWSLGRDPLDALFDVGITSNGTPIYYDRFPISRAECKVNDSISNELAFPSPGIASTSHQSNGTTLNTTIWLEYSHDVPNLVERNYINSLPVSFRTTENTSQMAYSILIIPAENRTLKEAVDDHIRLTNESSIGFHLYNNESFPLRLNDELAYRLTYGYKGNTTTEGCISCKEMDLLTLNDGKLHIFGYFGALEEFSDFMPTALEMIGTTQWKNTTNKATSDEPTQMTVHENATYRIRMNYPSDWSKDETTTQQGLYNNIITFYNYPDSDATISLSIDNSPVKLNLGENLNLDDYLQGTIKSYQNILDNFRLISKSVTATLDGNAAYNLTYTYDKGSVEMTVTEYGTMIGDDKVYYLEYKGSSPNYYTSLPIFSEMKNSLEINVSNLTYENTFLKMNYPYNWVKEEGGTQDGYNENNTYSYVTFYSPVKGPYHVYKAYQLDIDYDDPYRSDGEYRLPFAVRYQADRLTPNPHWFKLITDKSFDGKIERVLSNESGVKGLIEEGKGYITLSLDTDTLNLPDQIYITLRAQDIFLKDGKVCVLIDDTDFVASPPPEYSLSMSPTSLKEMRRGDDKNVEVQLRSNLTLPFDVIFSSTQNTLHTDFNPNNTTGITSGLTTSNLNIEIPKDLSEDRSYSIPIRADIQLRPTFNPGNRSFVNITKVIDYPVNVVSDLTLGQNISGFWNVFGPAITGTIAVLVPVGTAVAWFIRKRKNAFLVDSIVGLVKSREQGELNEEQFVRSIKKILREYF